ncbi:hypothetical protein ACH3XW_24330 [Acanthocheilonema viteae]
MLSTIAKIMIIIMMILAISTIPGNAGSGKKEGPVNPGFCFGPINFCAEGYVCAKIECVEERNQKMIDGKSIGPCLRGLCPNDYICYERNNRCYLIE